MFRVVKETLTVFLQEESGHTETSCPVDWFIECQGLKSQFLNIRDWVLSGLAYTILFGRYNLDTTLEFIGALDSLPEYKQWLDGHSEADILRLSKELRLNPEEKTTSTKSAELDVMTENTQLKLENEKLRLLAEQLDKDRTKLRVDLDELRREFDQFIKKSRGGVEDEAFD